MNYNNLSLEKLKEMGFSVIKTHYENGKLVYEEDQDDKSKITKKKFIVKEWYFLNEVCEMKGVNYKSVNNRPYLKPNNGIEDGIITGRKAWRLETIMKWLKQTDNELKELYKKKKNK